MEKKIEILEAALADFHTIAMIYNEFILLWTATMDETLKTTDDIVGWVQKFHKREKLYVIKINTCPETTNGNI